MVTKERWKKSSARSVRDFIEGVEAVVKAPQREERGESERGRRRAAASVVQKGEED